MTHLVWEYNSMDQWKQEYDQLVTLDIDGNSENLRRFSLFFAKTLDYITDPSHPHDH